MIINIKAKPRNRPSSVSTCVNEEKIYLYVSQKNCTMDKESDNYCQKCKDEYMVKVVIIAIINLKNLQIYIMMNNLKHLNSVKLMIQFIIVVFVQKVLISMKIILFQTHVKNVLNGNIQVL